MDRAAPTPTTSISSSLRPALSAALRRRARLLAVPPSPAHDAFTRLLHRLEPDPAILWREVSPLVVPTRGILIVDDTTLDKPYARKIELVHRHWSGKHHAVVNGITLLWSEGESLIPVDYRVFDKSNDGITKNEHFGAMLLTAEERGFLPECVLFDRWYASIDGALWAACT